MNAKMRKVWVVFVLLTCLFLSPIAAAESLPYPFFKGDGQPCVMYSTVASTGAGQVRAVDIGSPNVCYWVANVKVYGASPGAKISFRPDFMPNGTAIDSQFWRLTPELSRESAPFWVGYPLPAGGAVLQVGDLEWHVVLTKGENVFRLK